jgi:hypothetical protein
MVIIRFLFALLVGFLAGAGTTLWLVQSGTGDFMIRKTEVVQDLERRVREVEQQRDAVGRQLEDALARFNRMESAFTGLEGRFRDLLTAHEAARLRDGEPRAAEPRAGTEPTPAPTPSMQ